eukprot:3872443-Prymnesium_polylepis.2
MVTCFPLVTEDCVRNPLRVDVLKHPQSMHALKRQEEELGRALRQASECGKVHKVSWEGDEQTAVVRMTPVAALCAPKRCAMSGAPRTRCRIWLT